MARTAEMAGIVRKAAQDKEAFDAEIDSTIAKIAADKTAVHTVLNKAMVEQNAQSASVKAFVDTSLQISEHNSTQAKDAQVTFLTRLRHAQLPM